MFTISKYSHLLSLNFLDYNFTVEEFVSNADMETYVTASDYSKGSKRLCFGINMVKNNQNNQYEYQLRFNTSTN